MKILIARLNHETNTFSPVATPLAAFEPTYGADAYLANKGMQTAMAAFIDLAESLGAEIVTPVSASANPSGSWPETTPPPPPPRCSARPQTPPSCSARLPPGTPTRSTWPRRPCCELTRSNVLRNCFSLTP